MNKPRTFNLIIANPGARKVAAKKPKRTAAQRAATRRMIAANKAGGHKGHKKGKRKNPGHSAKKPPRHSSRRRHNPTEGKLGAIGYGALAAVGSEAIDWGTDQLTMLSAGWQGVVSGGAHAATAGLASMLDTRLEAGLVACGFKTVSQRIRVSRLLSDSTTATGTEPKKGITFDRQQPRDPSALPNPRDTPVPGPRRDAWPVRGSSRGAAAA